MYIPNIKDMELPGETRYSAMLDLQREINRNLREHFEDCKSKDPITIARSLVSRVEFIVDELNKCGYRLARSEYGGDIDYENSEQWYCNGPEMGTGLHIHFLGFTAQVYWEES